MDTILNRRWLLAAHTYSHNGIHFNFIDFLSKTLEWIIVCLQEAHQHVTDRTFLRVIILIQLD